MPSLLSVMLPARAVKFLTWDGLPSVGTTVTAFSAGALGALAVLRLTNPGGGSRRVPNGVSPADVEATVRQVLVAATTGNGYMINDGDSDSDNEAAEPVMLRLATVDGAREVAETVIRYGFNAGTEDQPQIVWPATRKDIADALAGAVRLDGLAAAVSEKCPSLVKQTDLPGLLGTEMFKQALATIILDNLQEQVANVEGPFAGLVTQAALKEAFGAHQHVIFDLLIKGGVMSSEQLTAILAPTPTGGDGDVTERDGDGGDGDGDGQ